MKTLKCNTCGGIYTDVQRDGTEYYHACPPLSVHEARDLLAARTIQLTAAQAQQLDVLDKLPKPLAPDPNYVPPGDAYLAQLALPRPNSRDENIVVDKGGARPKADGPGATVIAETP